MKTVILMVLSAAGIRLLIPLAQYVHETHAEAGPSAFVLSIEFLLALTALALCISAVWCMVDLWRVYVLPMLRELL